MTERMAGMAEQFMSSWQSEIFRQRCVAQIESVRSQTNPQTNSSDPVENFLGQNNSTQLEEFVFNKSKTREEYMSLVSDMMIMLRQHAGKPTVDMSVLKNADPAALAQAGMSAEEQEHVSQNGATEEGEDMKKEEESNEESKEEETKE